MKYHQSLHSASSDTIFVFGSNLAGRHGAGAAAYAKQFCGAERGVGVGITGRCYAIPTKDRNIQTLPLEQIKPYVDQFIHFATCTEEGTDLDFFITRIGCGLAGYTDYQMATLFAINPFIYMQDNLIFPIEWKKWLAINDD